MKKMLFIFPHYYGFDKVIGDGFEEFSDYDLVKVNPSEKYFYKNLGERLKNLVYKTFLKKNLKKIAKERKILEKINQFEYYEVAFINRPDLLSEKIIRVIQKKAKKTIVHYWDSFEKIKGLKETIPYFDKKFSFDTDDCANYNLNFTNNFYFDTRTNESIKYDLAYLGTYDKRFDNLISILTANNTLSYKTAIFSKKKIKWKENLLKITFINKIIPFKDAVNFYKDSKIILDISHPNQKGLSFRPFEAIGLKKKLVTTNVEIKNYDFYDPENIYIITNLNEPIPEKFINSNYKELPIHIYEKYSLKNWIQTILQE